MPPNAPARWRSRPSSPRRGATASTWYSTPPTRRSSCARTASSCAASRPRAPSSAARASPPGRSPGRPTPTRWSPQLQEPERPRIPIQAPEADPASARAPITSTATPSFGAAQDAAFARNPTYYRLRFDPPLDVSILGEAGTADLPGRLWRARHRLIEGWEALVATLGGRPVPPRVVLTLTPADARRLFVTFLPKMRLVVAGPPPA